MRARVWLLPLILGVPVLGFVASTAIQDHLNSELRTAIRRQNPAANAAAVTSLTLRQACENAPAEMDDICGTSDRLALIETASVVAGGVGLALMGLIVAGSVAAQSNRELLLSLFRPGLYITATALTGLIVAHAAILIGTINYGEAALVNRVHYGIILTVGLGAAAGVVAVARSAFGVVKKAEASALGQAVSAQEAPKLWDLTDRLANTLNALRPDHIVVGLDPTFYVTEANVTTLNGQLTGRTLYCSLPLARILTVDEFGAIIGHELGHFRGEDTKFSEGFYPIYRGSATAIAALEAAGGRGIGAVALLPAIAVFGLFLERFAVAESRLGRERELAADQAGVEATSQRTMASALVKVHAFVPAWGGVNRAAMLALKEEKMLTNASMAFAESVAAGATPKAFEGIADTHTSHPTDSHPPLAARLSALGVDLSAVADEALVVAPEAPALTLVDDAETLEVSLSEAHQKMLANHLAFLEALEQAQSEARFGRG